MDEKVILVDNNDEILGYMNKLELIKRDCYIEQFRYLFLIKVMKCFYREGHKVSITPRVFGVIQRVVIQEKMNQFLKLQIEDYLKKWD